MLSYSFPFFWLLVSPNCYLRLVCLNLLQVFSGLRIYALWLADGRLILTGAAFLLQLPPFAINLVRDT